MILFIQNNKDNNMNKLIKAIFGDCPKEGIEVNAKYINVIFPNVEKYIDELNDKYSDVELDTTFMLEVNEQEVFVAWGFTCESYDDDVSYGVFGLDDVSYGVFELDANTNFIITKANSSLD